MQGLQMKGITKTFPGVVALSNVDFEVAPGEIHALIGANGAGKSTLMKILSGAYSDYDGDIFIDGKQVRIGNPTDAINNGIVTVYQEVDTALVHYLTVAENVMMDALVHRQQNVFVNWNRLRRDAKRALDAVGLEVSVDQLISDLSLSEKQMVLLARAIDQRAKYLILDEPTAPLSMQETKTLFNILHRLRDEGMGIVFISHRLDEVFQVCDRVTVLRDGQMVGTYPASELTIDSAVEKMLGRKLQNTFPKINCPIGETILEVTNLSGTGGVHDVNMTVRAGEIVGLVGLVGGGKTELCKLLFGAGNVYGGEVKLKGEPIRVSSPTEAVRLGLALVPEERRREGVFVDEPIDTNLTLTTLEQYCVGPFMQRTRITSVSVDCVQRVSIRTPSEKQIAAKLSGGNQQKVSVGKWLLADAHVYIFDEPTKGVDVGSKSEIYALIGELAKSGKGIIYASCEFDEILGLTDRAYVMYNGTTVKELVTSETTEEEILFYSTGGGHHESANGNHEGAAPA